MTGGEEHVQAPKVPRAPQQTSTPWPGAPPPPDRPSEPGAPALPALGTYRASISAPSLGAGAARNKVGDVRFSFPGLGATASTVIPGGRETNFAWMAAAGVSLPVSSRLTLDVAYRYVDLGDVRTSAGPATITRTSGVRAIDIAPTYADLVTQGVSASVRLAF